MGYLTCEHDFHNNFGRPRPKIVVLCGSTRFGEEFREANLRETLAGRIVLSIGCDTKADSELWADPVVAARVKAELDELHKRKIDLADEVLVLDVGGYVGESTHSEIEYAEALGKPIRYLESGGTVPQPPASGTQDSETADPAPASAPDVPGPSDGRADLEAAYQQGKKDARRQMLEGLRARLTPQRIAELVGEQARPATTGAGRE